MQREEKRDFAAEREKKMRRTSKRFSELLCQFSDGSHCETGTSAVFFPIFFVLLLRKLQESNKSLPISFANHVLRGPIKIILVEIRFKKTITKRIIAIILRVKIITMCRSFDSKCQKWCGEKTNLKFQADLFMRLDCWPKSKNANHQIKSPKWMRI